MPDLMFFTALSVSVKRKPIPSKTNVGGFKLEPEAPPPDSEATTLESVLKLFLELRFGRTPAIAPSLLDLSEFVISKPVVWERPLRAFPKVLGSEIAQENKILSVVFF